MKTAELHIFFYVQHLLGIGHVQRASAIVQACLESGLQVTVASGGVPLNASVFSGARIVQLPPVKSADAEFSGLVDSSGTPVDEDFKRHRKSILLEAFEDSAADILLIENYPFGRRQLRWELLPLLELACSKSAKPMVVCSIRDVLQKRKRKREVESSAIIEKFFDLVLVHGQPDFIPLEESFSLAEKIRSKVKYTGFVTGSHQRRLIKGADGKDEVLVSAGGGAVGLAVMDMALRARNNGFLADCRWRFLVGPNFPANQLDELKENVPDDCVFEPARPDFPSLLRNCRLSVSQAGYNTVLDILLAGCSSVLIPFEAGGESEQLMRASKLVSSGRCAVVREDKLTVENFTQAANLAMSQSSTMPNGVECNGGKKTAMLLQQQWQIENGS